MFWQALGTPRALGWLQSDHAHSAQAKFVLAHSQPFADYRIIWISWGQGAGDGTLQVCLSVNASAAACLQRRKFGDSGPLRCSSRML